MAFMENMTNQSRKVSLEMLELNELCDMEIAGIDSAAPHRVHAIVLASISKQIMGDSHSRLMLPYSDKVVKNIIDFAYRGECKMEDDVLVQMIDFSLEFRVNKLKEYCEQYLVSSITVSNAFEYLQLAKRLHISIQNMIIKFISTNIQMLKYNSELIKLDHPSFVDVLESNYLDMDQTEIKSFIDLWISNNNRLTRSESQKLNKAAQIPTSTRIPRLIILAIGGWEDEPTGRTEMFNPLTRNWTDISRKFKLPENSFAYHGIEKIGNFLFIIGGFTAGGFNSGFQDCLYRCDLRDPRSWRPMSFMNSKRCYISTVVLNDKIYAIGGHSGFGTERLRTAEVYKPIRNQWDDIASMNQARSDFTTVVYNNAIYAIGGFNGEEYLSSIEKYDEDSNTWTMVGNLTTPRSGASAVVVQDKIFVFGGFDGEERLKSVECFTPGLIRFHWHPVPNMLNRRSNFAACAINDQTIMVLGGFKNGLDDAGEACSNVEILNLVNNEWVQSSNLNIPRSALACILCDNLMEFK